MPKPDWSRKLAKPIDIGDPRKLRTLAGARVSVAYPRGTADHSVWQYITRLIIEAARSGKPVDLTVPFALARLSRH
jgi:hypothetical protein